MSHPVNCAVEYQPAPASPVSAILAKLHGFQSVTWSASAIHRYREETLLHVERDLGVDQGDRAFCHRSQEFWCVPRESNTAPGGAEKPG